MTFYAVCFWTSHFALTFHVIQAVMSANLQRRKADKGWWRSPEHKRTLGDTCHPPNKRALFMLICELITMLRSVNSANWAILVPPTGKVLYRNLPADGNIFKVSTAIRTARQMDRPRREVGPPRVCVRFPFHLFLNEHDAHGRHEARWRRGRSWRRRQRGDKKQACEG